jgi:hypothetical protein
MRTLNLNALLNRALFVVIALVVITVFYGCAN